MTTTMLRVEDVKERAARGTGTGAGMGRVLMRTLRGIAWRVLDMETEIEVLDGEAGGRP